MEPVDGVTRVRTLRAGAKVSARDRKDTVIFTEQLFGGSIGGWHLAQGTVSSSLRERDPIH